MLFIIKLNLEKIGLTRRMEESDWTRYRIF